MCLRHVPRTTCWLHRTTLTRARKGGDGFGESAYEYQAAVDVRLAMTMQPQDARGDAEQDPDPDDGDECDIDPDGYAGGELPAPAKQRRPTMAVGGTLKGGGMQQLMHGHGADGWGDAEADTNLTYDTLPGALEVPPTFAAAADSTHEHNQDGAEFDGNRQPRHCDHSMRTLPTDLLRAGGRWCPSADPSPAPPPHMHGRVRAHTHTRGRAAPRFVRARIQTVAKGGVALGLLGGAPFLCPPHATKGPPVHLCVTWFARVPRCCRQRRCACPGSDFGFGNDADGGLTF